MAEEKVKNEKNAVEQTEEAKANEAASEEEEDQQSNEEEFHVIDNGDLIFLTKVKTFWLEPLIAYLEDNNIKIGHVELEANNISAEILTARYVFIQAEDFAEKNAGFLMKLCEVCNLTGLRIIVFGTAEGVKAVKKKIQQDELISLALERPCDVKIVGKKILSRILGSSETISVSRKSILAVDDAGFMLRTIKSWLEDDYDVYVANSASKAMTMLKSPKPDLILMDYEMPVCSGAQFFAMLQDEEETADIPVIFLTAKDDRETVTEVLNLRPAGYLLKTTSKAQLIDKIEEVWAKAKEHN